MLVKSIKDFHLVYNLIDLTSINLMFDGQLPANFIIILQFTYFCKSEIDYIQNYKRLHEFLNNNIVFMWGQRSYQNIGCVRVEHYFFPPIKHIVILGFGATFGFAARGFYHLDLFAINYYLE